MFCLLWVLCVFR